MEGWFEGRKCEWKRKLRAENFRALADRWRRWMSVQERVTEVRKRKKKGVRKDKVI